MSIENVCRVGAKTSGQVAALDPPLPAPAPDPPRPLLPPAAPPPHAAANNAAPTSQRAQVRAVDDCLPRPRPVPAIGSAPKSATCVPRHRAAPPGTSAALTIPYW